MSRAYRIRVRESLRRTLRAEDRVQSELELLEILPAETMAERLRAAGVASARGFSANVSNFKLTADEQRYAESLRTLLGGSARYVIDTSRNGRGWTGDWCNPSGVGLGSTPRAVSGSGGLDALLWIKRPGESDGECNGGPAAGGWC